MKKIFAIALALVMVLSMASAFAFVGTCGKYEYTCPTASCGVAKAEVVKFVGNNTIDHFQESPDCAAIVVGNPIYWAVKVTFDKDVNEQWYYHEDTKLVVNETVGGTKTMLLGGKLCMLANKKASAVSGKTYWLLPTWNGDTITDATLVEDWTPDVVFMTNPTTTRDNIAAEVVFDFNGVTAATSDLDYTTLPAGVTAPDTEWIDYGSFKVRVYKDTTSSFDYAITIKKGGDTATIWVINGIAKYVSEEMTSTAGTYYSSFDGTTFKGIKGKIENGKATGNETAVVASCTSLDDLMALVGIKLGDCVDGGTIKAIFGWSDKGAYGNKATWNKDAVAIANAECQVKVEIPKTGDVSVIAYAVMALVAAAGAMGLKK